MYIWFSELFFNKSFLSIFLLGVDFDILPSSTVYSIFIFSEFVQNSLGFDMGMVIFDL